VLPCLSLPACTPCLDYLCSVFAQAGLHCPFHCFPFRRCCTLLHTFRVPLYPFAVSRSSRCILFSMYRLPSFIYLGLRLFGPLRSHVTMAAADFSQFVVTTLCFEYCLFLCACETSSGKDGNLPLMYLLHLHHKVRAVSDFVLSSRLVRLVLPYMQFLFVRPRVCPWRHFSAPTSDFLQTPPHDGRPCL
jgi:hypothetical protein